ncbi:MAG: hypothetical protein ACKVT0_11080 [Planctomycetaceae bacterium]
MLLQRGDRILRSLDIGRQRIAFLDGVVELLTQLDDGLHQRRLSQRAAVGIHLDFPVAENRVGVLLVADPDLIECRTAGLFQRLDLFVQLANGIVGRALVGIGFFELRGFFFQVVIK